MCNDFSRGKEILEVKKEGKIPKSAPKKRGRPPKEKTATKKAKTNIIDLEDMEDVRIRKQSGGILKWKL
jgi:hypothetical protein